MNQIVPCGRCGSKIVQQSFNRDRPVQFIRRIGPDKVESEELQLCSMCLDDLWEFAFDADIDRSDKADPVPLQKMEQGVNRHIDDLKSVLEEMDQ